MISADVIEKYQQLMRHNPQSQVFAPLADAYLQRGLDMQALELATLGTQRHPTFPAGFLVLGKIQLKLKKLKEAELSLQKAIELSPQNILAHQLLGDVYLEQRHPLEALKAYKMVLFLNPYSQKAKLAVEKLETASALEFEEETFAMARLSDLRQVQKTDWAQTGTAIGLEQNEAHQDKARKRLLQLADAFLIRNDTLKAYELLQEIQNEYGPHPDIESRIQKALKKPIKKPEVPSSNKAEAPSGTALTRRIDREKKLRKLYAMLRAVRLHQLVQPQESP